MATGLDTLHKIDTAISRARSSVSEASALPVKASEALLNVQRQQALAYEQIAADRLDILGDGAGGALGYVDRQAEKLLEAHAAEEGIISQKITDAHADIQSLEDQRRLDEQAARKAIDAYDKAVAAAEIEILKNPIYISQLNAVSEAEGTYARASEKLELAREDETEKGEPYRKDPFFAYLRKREFGTKNAKGWFLTKLLDRWVARKINYRQAAENYRRLTAIPRRIENHVALLAEKSETAQAELQSLEAEMLQAEGVTAKHEASLKAQEKLDATDAAIETAEKAGQALRAEHTAIAAGESQPYREAIAIISSALQRKDLPSLRRLAAQTASLDDDRAIENLRELAQSARDLADDRAEAEGLLRKYQHTLGDLETVRQRFKQKRYDAPSSTFSQSSLITALLSQVLAGALSGNDFWRQLQRAQRTVRRYSDSDFGGIDWTEGLRLPRSTPRRGGWGGGYPSRGGGGAPRRRTSIPRAPRRSLPKVRTPRSKSGGFRTGGGF